MPEIESFADAVNQATEALNQDEGRSAAPQQTQQTTETKTEQQQEQSKEVKQPEQKQVETKTEEKPSASKLMGKKVEKVAPKADENGDVKLDWSTAPAKMRKAFEHQSAELTSSKTLLKSLQDKIAAIEAKPVETKQDTKLLEQFQSEVKQLKQTIAELDYQRSDEFKEKYVTRFNKAYEQAIGEVTQLQVNTGNDDAPTRPATQADFDGLRALPFGQRRAAARRLFGEDADVALQHVASLERIRAEANEALESQKSNYEKIQAEKKLNQERESVEHMRMVDGYRNEIYEAYPDVFTPGEGDTESAEMLKDGRAFSENFFNGLDKMQPQDRAMHRAVAIARLESWPLLQRMSQMKDERIASLEKELAGLRGKDPGSAGAKKQVEAKSAEDDVPTFSSIEKQFNTLPKD